MASLSNSSYLIANWTYVSQYIKTCVLLPNLVSKAKLLQESHHAAVWGSYKNFSTSKEFFDINDLIDKDIKKQNVRFKRIGLLFLVVDMIASAVIIGTTTWIFYL